MLQRISLALLVVSGLVFWVPARASDLVYPGGGVLAEIAGGGGIQTTIALANLDSLPAPYPDVLRRPWQSADAQHHRGTA